jgi:hypothetical protein
MDPKLKAILMKSKEIDNAAKKYDTVDSTVLEGRVNKRAGSPTPSSGGGLYDQMGGGSSMVTSAPEVNVYSEEYQERVANSGLPPEVQKAMSENPIPQPSSVSSISEEDIRDLNPGAYSEEDEYETMTEERRPVRRETSVPHTNTNSTDIRRIVAEEVAKVLPKVLENYFDKKIIKENTRLMKVLLKSSQGSKKRV